MVELLKQLTEAMGVSGNEGEVRAIIRGLVEPLADEVSVDRLGNVIAYKKGRTSHKRVMLCAHMDEVGFIITSVGENGMLKFKPVGGMDPRVLVSKRVLVGDDRLPGVLGIKAIHLQEPDERKNAVRLKQMVIDIGAKSRDEAEKLVKIGDYGMFHSSFTPFGQDKVKAKALDDRAGCAALIEVLKDSYDCDIVACFTVQEEVGLRGAGVAVNHAKPDLALVIESTTCADVPDVETHQYTTRMGRGPAISFMDRSIIVNRELYGRLLKTAEVEGIPAQIKENVSGGNDAGRIHLSGEGVPTAVISIPCRYIHSPSSVMDMNDFRNTIKLVKAFLKGCGQ